MGAPRVEISKGLAYLCIEMTAPAMPVSKPNKMDPRLAKTDTLSAARCCLSNVKVSIVSNNSVAVHFLRVIWCPWNRSNSITLTMPVYSKASQCNLDIMFSSRCSIKMAEVVRMCYPIAINIPCPMGYSGPPLSVNGIACRSIHALPYGRDG